MPLITFSGLPSSGKTTLANELSKFIASQGHEVKVISFESLGIDRNIGYQSKRNTIVMNIFRDNYKLLTRRLNERENDKRGDQGSSRERFK